MKKDELSNCKKGDKIKINKTVKNRNEHLFTVGKPYEIIDVNDTLTPGQIIDYEKEIVTPSLVESGKFGWLQIIADNGKKVHINPAKSEWNHWVVFKRFVLDNHNLKEKESEISTLFITEMLLYQQVFEKQGFVNASFERILKDKEIALVELLGFEHQINTFPLKKREALGPFGNDVPYSVSSIHKHSD